MNERRIVRHWEDVRKYVTIILTILCLTQILVVAFLMPYCGVGILIFEIPLTVALYYVILLARRL